MDCSNCGKDIPYDGRVCPWCHAEKSADKDSYSLSMFFGIVGFIVGRVTHDVGSGVIGMVIGVILGTYLARRANKS